MGNNVSSPATTPASSPASTPVSTPKNKYEKLMQEVRNTPLNPGKFELEFPKEHEQQDFTSKKIDEFIHLKGWDTTYPCSHVEHQQKIISVISGNEKRLFNDQTFMYPTKALRGKTGRMSAILRNCFFSLFNYLLDPRFDIEINPVYTQNFIFNALCGMRFNYLQGKLLLPTSEFESLKSILRYLKTNYEEELPLFSEETWRTMRAEIQEKKALIETKPFWINTPEENKWQRLVGNYLGNYFPYGGYEYYFWEYFPCYIIHKIRYNDSDKKLAYIQNMFLSPNSCKNIDENCDTTSCTPRVNTPRVNTPRVNTPRANTPRANTRTNRINPTNRNTRRALSPNRKGKWKTKK